jgi:phosphatidylglycerophosphatase C
MNDIAFFDFDGTITNKDSTNEFFKFILNPWYFYFIKYIFTLPYLILYKIQIIDSSQLKKKRYKYFLSKFNFIEIENYGNLFYYSKLNSLVKQSALDEIKWHKDKKNDIYIVSASLDVILNKWCEINEVALITNKLEFKNNKFTGNFLSPDCNGYEKVLRIKDKIILKNYNIVYAYGDTIKDIPMLNLATKKYYRYFK